jgi:hypothetical protein
LRRGFGCWSRSSGSLVFHHDEIRRLQVRAERAAAYERGLARIEDRRMGTGQPCSVLNLASNAVSVRR